MKKRSNRILAVLLSLILALTLAVPAFAGTRQEQVALVLGENELTLDNVFSTAYYYFTPEESGKYIIRSVSTPPSDPYMEYNLASYLDYGDTKDFYCVATLTAGVAAEFLIRDTVENIYRTLAEPAVARRQCALAEPESLCRGIFLYPRGIGRL